MSSLRAAVIGLVLALSSAAYADRVYDLLGVVKLKAVGESIEGVATGTLNLLDDGTYTLSLSLEGEEDSSNGIWLEEGKAIQLFQEEPRISESIADFEGFLSLVTGFDLRVTSIRSKEKVKKGKSGDISAVSKTSWTIRMVGFDEGKPVKVTESIKLIGVLQP